ncbi:MAG: NAD(P)-binding protein [Terriglobales bacterium]
MADKNQERGDAAAFRGPKAWKRATRPQGQGEQPGDRALGLDQPIQRRDFLNASLLATGGALLEAAAPAQLLAQGPDWTGYGGIGDYRDSNGNTEAVMQAGHQIRDHDYPDLPASTVDTGETYDLVVIGGGISGLAAALFFRRAAPGRRCLILENHPVFGGEAKRNEFLVDGQRLIAHQGSAFFPVPYPYSFIARFYRSIGLEKFWLDYQGWAGPGPEMPLSQTPYDQLGSEGAQYGFYFGAKFGQNPGQWLVDPWGQKLAGAPIPAAAREDLLRWWFGPPVHPQPRPQAPGDAISRELDAITQEELIMRVYGIRRETIREYLSPVTGGGYGLGPDALSAYCHYAADELHALPTPGRNGGQMFPGGNCGFARLIAKALIPAAIPGPATVENVLRRRIQFAALDADGAPARLRLGATAVRVRHEGPPERASSVAIGYTQGGRVYRLRARAVVAAGGSWTTRAIIRDLPAAQREAYAQFYRSPCLMANVAVRNWRFLDKLGISGCRWFEGLGNYTEVCKTALAGGAMPTIGPDSPVVLNLKILFARPGLPVAEQGVRGRYDLLTTTYRSYERQIRRQFTEMFARAGFDAKRDIAGIVLNRWGHAYVNPQPGFFFGRNGEPAPREVLRRAPFGRIAFANTDLAGLADHRHSIDEGRRAVAQLLDQVLD